MGMKSSNMAGVLAMAIAMSGDSMMREEYSDNKKVLRKKPIKKIIPKGCKEYFFNQNGSFSNEYSEHRAEHIFYCVASNDKTAIKKFNKHLLKQ